MLDTPSTGDITITDVPGSLPPDNVPRDLDLSALPAIALRLLQNVTRENLLGDAAWVDWLALTGRVRTYNGAEGVVRTWNRAVEVRKVHGLQVGSAEASVPPLGTSWVTVPFTFKAVQREDLVGVCSGRVAVVPDLEGGWKIWFIATMLEWFEGWGDPDLPLGRPVDRGFEGSGEEDEQEEFQVVVVGAGQNGLALAGRLQALCIKYVLLERLPEVGMSWTMKYDTVRQHTIREFNNLPFDRTWNADDDNLLSAKRVAEGFQNYAKKYNLNVWTSVDVSVRSWDSTQRRWIVNIARNDGSGKKRSITCKHLALAVGGGVSQPNRPKYAGEENFKGKFMLVRDFRNGREWRGKHGVVIGTGTTGHDIAQDMLDNGLASVTMIQRQKTAIYPIDWVMAGQGGLYNTNVPTGTADRISFLMPLKTTVELMTRSYKAYLEANKAYFDALEATGFRVDKDSRLYDQIFRRWGGYYVDVGTSERIINGDIKIKSGVAISNFTEDGIVFADRTEIKADLVVLAAGYEHDYRRQVATVVGDDIAKDLGEFWGWTKDGDVNGIIQEMAPGLWLLAGPCPEARFWSRFTALKMQADFLGKPLVDLSEDDGEIRNGIVNGVH